MARIVGIDFGLKRIGLALSDPLRSYAVPLTTIERVKSDQETVKLILKHLDKLSQIELFVIGLPLHLSGAESPMSAQVKAFALVLEQETEKKVVFIDERLTSKQAEGLLMQRDMKRKDRSKVIDTLSASLILQTYLDQIRCRKSESDDTSQ